MCSHFKVGRRDWCGNSLHQIHWQLHRWGELGVWPVGVVYSVWFPFSDQRDIQRSHSDVESVQQHSSLCGPGGNKVHSLFHLMVDTSLSPLQRPGAFAIYLEPWHPDIIDFLDLKKNHGAEEKVNSDLFQ